MTSTGNWQPETGNPLLAAALLSVLCALLPAEDPWRALDHAMSVAETQAATARSQLEELLVAQPDFAPAQYNLGCLLLSEDPAAAARYLEQATASKQPALSARAWHNLAHARYHSGQLEAALAAAGTAVQQQPDNETFLQTRDELRRIYAIRQDEARRRAEEEAKRLRLTTELLPHAFVDEAYQAELNAAGGDGGPYSFQPDPDHPLPEGLLVGVAGGISGTPTTATDGPMEAVVVVTDSNDASARGSVRIQVWPEPSISPDSLPECIIEQPYQADFRAQGLPQPQWTITGLPEGLDYAAIGGGMGVRISGQTTAVGAYPLHITASWQHRSAELTPTLTVSDSFAPDTSTMPPATAFAVYEHQLTVRGPAQHYQFEGGSEDFAVDPFGRVSGDAPAAGEHALPLTITAEDGRQRRFELQLPINPPPVIEESEPISLIQCRAADRRLRGRDGTPPYRWDVVEGLLPEGLRLEEDGRISGAPQHVGEVAVTVALSDRWQARTQTELSFVITEPDQQDQQAPQDQQEQEQQDQQQQDQDQQQQDQQQQDQQNQQQQDQQNQQDQQAQEQQAQQQADQQQQAQRVQEAAAQQWLDQLPEEQRDALLRQLLLQQGDRRGQGPEKPW